MQTVLSETNFFQSFASLHVKLSLKECWLSLLPSQSSICIIRRHWNDYNLKIMYFKYTCSFLFIIMDTGGAQTSRRLEQMICAIVRKETTCCIRLPFRSVRKHLSVTLRSTQHLDRSCRSSSWVTLGPRSQHLSYRCSLLRFANDTFRDRRWLATREKELEAVCIRGKPD